MNQEVHKSYCKLGEQADRLTDSGDLAAALKVYHQLHTDLSKNPETDAYLSAKLTLGKLKALTLAGKFKRAFDVWNAHLEKNQYGVGIYALENAQVSLADLITYDMICAHLHSLRNSKKEEMASAVTQYMSRVCEHAEEVGDRGLMYQAISNWKQHLREIFKSTIPFEWAKPVIRFEKDLGDQVKLKSIEFPKLSRWEKPVDLAEAETPLDLLRRSTLNKAPSSAMPLLTPTSKKKA